MRTLLQQALQFRQIGFSVIPVKQDKTPFIKWEQYQKEPADESMINAWWNRFPNANIGLVTGTISGLAVIDIDTDEGFEAIAELIAGDLVIPTVVTPGGGKHYYFRCSDKNLSNNSRTIPGCDLRANGGYVLAPGSTNGNGKAYTWEQGLSIFEHQLIDLPDSYLEAIGHMPGNATLKGASNINNNSLYKGRVDNRDDTPTPQMSTKYTTVHIPFTQGCRDQDLFTVANSLVRCRVDRPLIDKALEILANNCSPNFPQDEATAKIESAIKRIKMHSNSLAEEVKQFAMSTTGIFTSTDVHNSLYLSTKAEKKNVSEILRRMCEKGLIEKSGNRHGQFRKIEAEVNEINFLSAPTEKINLRLPFGIETYVDVYPKNICIVAGSPDSGKTAFLLNTAELNMDKHDVYYFSSEMGDQELRLRLSKFDRNLNDFQKIKWLERSTDFADVIQPDAINIIDFLEIHEDFWKVGLFIKQIYDKLRKGIAIIALQKDKAKEYGLGATRSLEKSRLYIAMNPNELIIKKAKNWANTTINPNGMKCKFKLIDGCKFIKSGAWSKE